MCNCSKQDTLIPQLGVITEIRTNTADVKTFSVSLPQGGVCFGHMPGQCAMLSVPGVGEAIFSITSSPTNTSCQEFSIKKCGSLTDWLHRVEPGQQIGIRGPYGNAFPVEEDLLGKNLLFVAGGIGIAPLRSVIQYVLHHRERYGKVDIVYGARSGADLVDYEEMKTQWSAIEGVDVHVTIDRPEDGWNGHVGMVPDYLKELGFSVDRTALVCGPPIMIKYALKALLELGFAKEQVFTTLELRMKCGVGKCGRCNIGSKYVCKDGPVFRCDELDDLPDEY